VEVASLLEQVAAAQAVVAGGALELAAPSV
jgi:hypothetical protein